ncbi:hypothetical protein MCOR03_010706 [Pyricularia oryzae]|uniref:Rhodopsin domain-containing protein n=1 Tax=Pyricularia grisea TaxID=148305 RepID=A0ABQ8NYR1_PYRGI|nr:hypothetical protein MCOR01_010215 [Pyricularia oryzae]KAI6304076.1 hypothetical protein MCOR33_000822 [Pyricularia grisea]KAI6348855.1 hypothetical protein MCOR30_000121 [Pyricularia oryzae]KAI6412059.1 hypothetical protein MCOR20_003873 [Pyricularia oryzae]KAI6507408.1 hypothetical protein MCOR10_011191 [Pyricularia oryzae]
MCLLNIASGVHKNSTNETALIVLQSIKVSRSSSPSKMSNPTIGSDEWKAQDKGPAVLAVSWIVIILSSAFVIFRIYVNGCIRGKLRSDDWFIIVGQICGYVAVIFTTLAARSGNGRHVAVLTQDQLSGSIFWSTIAFVPGSLFIGIPKLAVVTVLTRLLNPTRYHTWFLWWLPIWCISSVVVAFILVLTRCSPTSTLWDPSVQGKCFDIKHLVNYGIYSGICCSIVDFYLAIYPSVVLFKLQLSFKKKVALSCALGVGSISGVIAVIKTVRTTALLSQDFTYDVPDLIVWLLIEGSSIIIASSIPVLQPLLEVIVKHNPFSTKGTSAAFSFRRGKGSSKYKSGSNPSNFTKESCQHCKHCNGTDSMHHPPTKDREDLSYMVDSVIGTKEDTVIQHGSFHYSTSVLGAGTPQNNGLGGDNESSPVTMGGIVRTDVVNISYGNAK